MTIELKAIEAQIPKIGTINREVSKGIIQSSKLLQADYREIGRTFSRRNRPKVRSRRKSRFNVVVTASSPTIGYLNSGTGIYGPKRRKITIRPKRKGFLAFRSRYRAKSRPGVLKSGSGGSSGRFVYTRKPIKVRGIRPRNYQDVILSRRSIQIQVILFNSLVKGIKV